MLSRLNGLKSVMGQCQIASGWRRASALALVACGASAAAATHTDLTVGSFRTIGDAAVSVEHVDLASGSRGTLQFDGTPSCFGLACSIAGPAAGAYSRSSTQVLSILDYGFSVLGPVATIVPLLVSGMYSNINPLVADGSTNSGLYVMLGQGATGATFASNCYNFLHPENQEYPSAFNCGVGTYQMSFAASTVGAVSVELLAYVQPLGFRLDANAGLVSAFVDPYIEIDPAWLSSHPGYSLRFDDGVANLAAVTPVPEPETVALLVAGLALLATRRRCRKAPAGKRSSCSRR